MVAILTVVIFLLLALFDHYDLANKITAKLTRSTVLQVHTRMQAYMGHTLDVLFMIFFPPPVQA